jgi:peptidoglycan/xylan/chitin deacetylase (PgdA/CDA1 family)
MAMLKGKRELLSQGLHWSGARLLFEKLPEKDVLLVLNYHRIGDAEEDDFDSNVFSVNADQFNEQVAYLKEHLTLVTLDEALAFIDGKAKDRTPRSRVLITFDDGYMDNYEVAFPILRSHGAQGVFFLTTDLVGSCRVPWWDAIAFIIKSARRKQFTLRFPYQLSVDIDQDGLSDSLRSVVKAYYGPENTDPDRFILELKEAAQGDDPPTTMRRFLNWDEAREMIAGGMAIGSHTIHHPILSRLGREDQRRELAQSRATLKDKLGMNAEALAYPFGVEDSFSAQTMEIAQETGYRAAFSFYGGTNRRGMTRPFNVKRVSIGYQSWLRFRVQAAVCRSTGSYWP